MKRAAIYARHSSDLQNAKSCRDQIELCKQWAEPRGFTIVGSYRDEGVSGASVINRPGLADLMQNALSGAFDILICEALDRLSRHQADLHSLRRDLEFHDITIHTVQDGEVSPVQAGIKGMMSELYLSDLGQKTKRGLAAVVQEGRSAGGRSYGYACKTGEKGKLLIDPDEAEIVRRIFANYIDGDSPRQIAKRLNQDGILSPRGGKWNASTINGSKSRQNGILNNRLYIGETVWNRQRFVKNPSSGRRVSRLNPESEWKRAIDPDLRIIDEETWEAAAAIKARRSNEKSHHITKPKHLLSGLIKCGACGSSYTVAGRDRLACSRHRESGDCSNNRSIARHHVEERVLAALQQQLAEPDLIKEYLRAYQEERDRLQGQEQAVSEALRKKIEKLKAQIDRAVNAILKGTASATLTTRLGEMEEEAKRLEQELANLQADTQPFTMHPQSAKTYVRIIDRLKDHLDDLPVGKERDDIFLQIRQLIDCVTIIPKGERKPVDIEVKGLLAALLSLSADPTEMKCRGVLVAGAGFEPATFRL